MKATITEIMELLSQLDGCGLIVENEDTIREELESLGYSEGA